MLDYGAPFFFVFKDEHWFRKILIASLLSYTLIGAAPVFGWTIEAARRVAQDEQPILPEFKDWKLFWTLGGKFALANILWLLPLLLASLLLYGVPAVLIGVVPDESVLLLFGAALACVLIFLFVFSWVYIFFIQPMMVSLADGRSAWQSANPVSLAKIVRSRFIDYFLVFIIIWLAFINVLFMLSAFTLFLLLPVALVYAGLVTAHFAGQLGRDEIRPVRSGNPPAGDSQD